MNRAINIICGFLFVCYSLQLAGVFLDVRIDNAKVFEQGLAITLYQIICVTLIWLFSIKRKKELTNISNRKIVGLHFFLILVFISVELMAIYLFLKEGIPIFDADPGSAKLRIADGNGFYIRYIKYFGNLIAFSLIAINIKNKKTKAFIIAIYFTTIALFGYRSELILLIIQYVVLASILTGVNLRRTNKLKSIFVIVFVTGIVGGLLYLSLGSDGEGQNFNENTERIINRLTIEQVESLPYVLKGSINNDYLPTNEFMKDVGAVVSRFTGDKQHSLFYGERLHEEVFGYMGANYLSVTTYGGELLSFFGFFAFLLIPIGLLIPLWMVKRIHSTSNPVIMAFLSCSIIILLQYLIAGNMFAFIFGPMITIIVMGLPVLLFVDLLKRVKIE